MDTLMPALRRGRSGSAAARLAALGRSELFAALPPEVLAVVADRSRICRYASGDVIFDTGGPGDALFVVVDGVVSIQEPGEDGASSVIAELVQGDTFGELDLLDQTERNATAVAGADTVVLRFPGPGIRFETTFARRPEVLARVLFSSLRVVAGRIRRANELIKENSPWVQEAQRQVYGDKLTGLYNKTYLEEQLPAALKAGEPAALLMLKPDNFKLINDTWGHEAGDAALRLMASELRRHAGEKDVAARYAGNELALVLPGCGRDAAAARAHEIREAMNRLDLTPAIGAGDTKLTASVGVAVYPEHGRDRTALIAAVADLPLVGRGRGGNLVLFPEDAR
jgi:diguanylate cyclase (GGDEF)-like protein